jgi:ferredoxin-NADP reductase
MRSTHGEVDLQLVVTATGSVADRVRSITFQRLGGGSLPSWSPGGHVDLTLGNDLVRQYSLCGDPANADEWTVVVGREDGSRGGSAYVHDSIDVGTVLPVRGPRNHFPLVDAPKYFFIAGGVGIAPLLPMLEQASSRDVPWRLVYGGSQRSAMAFAEDLLTQYGDKVQIVPEDEDGPLDVASLMQFDSGGTAIYCCGPEGLVSAVESMHARTRRGALHVERFSPRRLKTPRGTGAFEVEAARSGKVVTVDPGTSILDALGSAGVRVLSSCREGICGTCEVPVLAGVPEHRDSILTEAERQANETMFVCVSRCLSPRLVLDV